jgi:hypothetical protein
VADHRHRTSLVDSVMRHSFFRFDRKSLFKPFSIEPSKYLSIAYEKLRYQSYLDE